MWQITYNDKPWKTVDREFLDLSLAGASNYPACLAVAANSPGAPIAIGRDSGIRLRWVDDVAEENLKNLVGDNATGTSAKEKEDADD